MKKLIAILSALTLCMAVTGCKKENSNTNQQQTGEISQIYEEEEPTDEITSFKAEKLSLPENGNFLGGVQHLGENRYLVSTSDNTNMYQAVTDESFSSYTTINPQLPDGCDNNGVNYFEYAPESDGTVYALVTNTTYGGMTAPESYDETFDYEAYNEARYRQIYLVHYDKDFKIISSIPLDALTDFVNESENNFVTYMCPLTVWDENNLLISTSENELLLIDKETGAETGKIDTSTVDFENMSILPDRDGKLLCFFRTENSFEVCEVDKENNKLSEPFYIFAEEPRNALLTGTGEYRFFIGKTNGLYGFTDNGKIQLIMDWIESGIDTNDSRVQLACEDGSFIVGSFAENTAKPELHRYTRKEADEIKEVQQISVGYFGELSEFTGEINQFNQSFDEYSITTQQITSNEQLKLDIISGSAPDIVIHTDFSMVQQLSDKGVFADLYELMENDSEVNRQTVLPNVLTACESDDGELYAIPNYFDIRTLMIKSKYWDKPTMTAHELIDLYKTFPEDMQLTDGENTQRYVFELLANGGENFVDYEKAECYFDSTEFLEILEFCSTLPEKEEKPDKMTEPEAHQNYYRDKAMWLRNDMALTTDIPEFGYLYNYNYYKYGSFGEDVTLCGMPLSDESKPMIRLNFSFSIMNTCENKEAAWEFIKLCVQQEYKSESGEVIQWYHFPIMNDSFDKMALDSQKKQGINESFLGYDIPPLTQEDCDILKEYILTADIVQNDYYDSFVARICDEEIQAFFAGEQTAEETADYIQNRVSIMLSEQS